tara:strand:+ start:123 stop:446 length:324 start_codon:yes stop_codon:yes gene_type:complete
MGRYSRQISTQKPLTFCSDNLAETMIANEVRAGYSSNDIEILEDVTSEDFSEAYKPFMPPEWIAQEYARNRKADYPNIKDQLDEIYHNGIDSWKAVIKVTKDKFPKG